MASAPTDPYAEFEDQFRGLLGRLDGLRLTSSSLPDDERTALTKRVWDSINSWPPGLFWEWIDREFAKSNVPDETFNFANQLFRSINKGAVKLGSEGSAKSFEGADERIAESEAASSAFETKETGDDGGSFRMTPLPLKVGGGGEEKGANVENQNQIHEPTLTTSAPAGEGQSPDAGKPGEIPKPTSSGSATVIKGQVPEAPSGDLEDVTPEEIAEERIQICLVDRDAKLDLSDLELTELPEAIGDLRKLKQLDISNNQLAELPEAIGELTQLEKLDLVNNQLIDLPETIGDLTNLRELDLSNNQLATLPDVIGSLTNLRALFLSRNRLRNLPTSIGALKKLTVLHLHNNQLEELPYSIGELPELEKLRLESNKLQSLPAEMATMPKLGLIHVAQTDITHDSLLDNDWPENSLDRVDFGNPPQKKHKPPLRTHSDTATDEDQLGRGPAAEVLAARMNLIWQRHAKNQHTDPLVMHLNAPWGAGKSSYFLLLKNFLENPAMPKSSEDYYGATWPKSWAVVNMNAWQHQHVGAPWWSLFQIIFKQLKAQTSTPSAEYNMRWREMRRRFRGRELHLLTTAVLTVLGLAVIIFGGPGSELLASLFVTEVQDGAIANDNSGTANLIALFLGLPAVAGGIIKFIDYFRETLLPGDAATAERWTSIQKDPRNRLKEHFRGLVDDLDKPLLVFIDDLDRCQPKYVVELLEHIMTIFRHSKVFFLVAADGQWITRCFELEYKEFKDYHSDPGRSLGHHFLEKVFQFSIPLPQASKELRDAYWTLLTEPDFEATAPRNQTAAHTNKLFWALRYVLAHDFKKFRRFIFDKASEKKRPWWPSWLRALITAEVGDVLEQAPQKKSKRQKRLDDLNKKSSEATAVYAKEETEERIQSFLGPFSELVENNPRAMKRLVNAYIVQAIAETARHGRELNEDEEVRLARWTILQHRYPILIDYFRNNPHKIRAIVDPKVDADTAAFEDDKRVQAILEQKNKIADILKNPRTGHPTPIVLRPEHIADYLAVEI